MSSSRFLHIAVLALVAGVLLSCNKGKDDPKNQQKETADLLVCTFNIRYPEPSDGAYVWENRRDAVCKFIQTRKPDIIGMQEVEKVQAQYILSKTGEEYGLYGIGRESGKDILQVSGDETSNTILYKKSRFDLVDKGTFWHSDTPDQVAAKNKANDYGSWHTSHPLCTSWIKLADGDNMGRTVWLFNTHYQNNKNMSDVAPGLRLMESNLHISKIPDIIGGPIGRSCQDAVFLIGDFNSSFDTDALQALRNVPMGYAREDAAKSSFRTTATDNGYGKSSGIIDHMFFCGPLKALTYSLDKRDYGILFISDHYPVLTEFSYTDK